ncbi:MAG TPA: metallophosphatase [Cyanobacteria bacterium UBA11149]|nr:metallophosphatase [Cyanobacteria bacterium UBA11367]HBE57830.1 metallophosphatase [Cyanobacteria bacterium UBA11366]HBK66098.1 metallophosphatase [Cyanobacteria bacterium UBA11166]HBR73502.1 metallophosphatase [Cyanobacteria bacterium UBA11159]HBS68962.1 metallophosphatase [Cyanobacteria bacterium UBA11153]HBW91468.1 metallophosphatase [Cyanobacteria bacterium UBA11149]HCA96830.1 metallophosphatase [Cyanobacteria bacterium UBA9226]
MTHWAIMSGIEGNLPAYEAVLQDLKRQRQEIEALYILGDVIGPTPKSEKVIQRLQSPRQNEPVPVVCQGWWEEQLLILYGLGRSDEPTELINLYGKSMVKTLWDAVGKSYLEWIRSLDFGLFELDCLLIHGSSVSVGDELTPDTPAIEMLDRLMRMDANHLFCGRSGLTFQYEIEEGSITSTVTTLDSCIPPQSTVVKPRRVIGVGNVGRFPGKATYTLYNFFTNRVEFRTVRYGFGKGFQVKSPSS